MNRRRLLLSGLAMWAGPALAQPRPLVGDWSGVVPSGPGVGVVIRFRVLPDGKVVGLPAAAVGPTGRLTEMPAANPDGPTAPLRVQALTPERILLRWANPENPSVVAGRLIEGGRIEAAVAVRAAGGRAFPLVLTQGLTPESLRPARQELTDLGMEASRTLLELPALAARAQRVGEPARAWQVGERAAGSGVAVTADDLWHLGSITKWMTGTLVARLMEAGLVSWDDTVGDVLGMRTPDMRPVYRAVTIRHLLVHQGGMQRDPSMIEHAANLAPRDVMASRASLVGSALRKQAVGPVGGAPTYSNLGYMTIGAMLEAKLGRPWEELIRIHLFEPFGLASAGFGPPTGAGRFAQPYGHANSRPVAPRGLSSDNAPAYGPAGRIHMSLADVLTFLAAHRDHSPLLKQETWRVLQQPVPSAQTFTLAGCARTADGALIANGSNTRWYATAYVTGDRKVAAAAAANAAVSVSAVAVSAAESV